MDSQSQLTFTEAEVKKVEDFLNFIHQNAEFNLKAPDIHKYHSMYVDMVKICKEMRNSIMELVHTSKAPEKPKPVRQTKAKGKK